MKIVAVDVGFGFTKAYNGKEKLIFPSVFSATRNLLDVSLEKNANTLENLVVKYNGKQYFVGDKAIRERGSLTFSKDDMNRHLICSLSAIALLNKSDYKGMLIVGLPVSDAKYKAEELTSKLEGTHQITLGDITYTIEIEKVIVVVQGVSTFFDLCLSYQEDKVVFNELQNTKRLIIDIGEKTVDFISVNGYDIVQSETSCLDLGINTAYKRLTSVIQNKLGVTILPYEVVQYLDKIENEATEEIAELTNEILAGISAWVDIKSFIKAGNEIIITGGAAEIISLNIKNITGDNINCITVAADSQFSNVRGYFKYGLFKQQQQKLRSEQWQGGEVANE